MSFCCKAKLIKQDSIQQQYQTVGGDTTVAVHRQLTPAQVLSWLPRNATPAQQDSAIQAHFKPSEIRWSKRPDTLHLPGHDRGHNMLDVNIPQYYREGFFSNDTLFHPELQGGRYGVAGNPVPHTVQSDNLLTGLLLFSFLFAVMAIAKVKGFIARQFKSIVYSYRSDSADVRGTSAEVQFELFLMLLSALFIALLYYFYTLRYIGNSFILSSQYYLILIYFGIAIAYFLLKILLYSVVNNTFFGGKKSRQWMNSFLFVTSVGSVLFFPAVMMVAYSNISVENIIIYFVFALVIVKLLTIYQCYIIFFHSNVVKLQIILYFCALEIVPLLVLWGVLGMTANSMKVIF